MRTTPKQQRDALQARLAASQAEINRLAAALEHERWLTSLMLRALCAWNGLPVADEEPAPA